MAKSNLYMGWSDVTVVQGGVTTVIGQIKGVQFGLDNDREGWTSNGGNYNRLIVTRVHQRKMTITTGDIYKPLLIADNVPCTVTVTLFDATNGTGTGALTVVLSNAVKIGNGGAGDTAKFGMGTIAFEGFSPDDATDPLVVSQAP